MEISLGEFSEKNPGRRLLPPDPTLEVVATHEMVKRWSLTAKPEQPMSPEQTGSSRRKTEREIHQIPIYPNHSERVEIGLSVGVASEAGVARRYRCLSLCVPCVQLF